MDLLQIARSWYEYAKGSDYTKQLMDRRLRICSECPNRKEVASVEICGICKCPLAAKTAHPGNFCPDTPPRWNVAGTEV
jgi:hypothetical protein